MILSAVKTRKAILNLIELDDNSHNSESRKKRDKFINEVFASSGIPMIHIKAKNSYDKKLLIEELQRTYKTKYVFIKQENDKQGGPGCSLSIVLLLIIFFFLF